jgi:hypothetical protein
VAASNILLTEDLQQNLGSYTEPLFDEIVLGDGSEHRICSDRQNNPRASNCDFLELKEADRVPDGRPVGLRVGVIPNDRPLKTGETMVVNMPLDRERPVG